MKNHYTPSDVAKVLSAHLPKSINNILEPSVGVGVLLEPILNKISHDFNITCIDTDSEALNMTVMKLKKYENVSYDAINDDFLKWSCNKNTGHYDCVVMNPPFCGRSRDRVKVEFNDGNGYVQKSATVEVAFLVKAIEMLRIGGRLLAIVPSSVVSSDSSLWFREYLISQGSVKYIHELPKFTFKDVETRVYLMVFVKGGVSRSITLKNHELFQPRSMKLEIKCLQAGARMDFGYHEHISRFNRIRDTWDHMEWKELRDVVTVSRGKSSYSDNKNVIHTSDYSGGFWCRHIPPLDTYSNQVDTVESGTILVKRVGRHCSETFGWVSGGQGKEISDCILKISPIDRKQSSSILFWLRVLVSDKDQYRIIERGTGASYLSKNVLLNSKIPTKPTHGFEKLMCLYSNALRSRRFDYMVSIENTAREQLKRI